ncbi:MAG TPA: arylamine N-acetyltransferase [Cellvibrio sp.]
MKAENFKLTDYARRIGYTGELTASVTTLTEFMKRQLLTVPFENLDVQAGKIVSLVPEDIAGKILYKPRGGYCYEVNGLFAMALEALGIEYQILGARPMFYPTRRARTHMVIIAKIDGRQFLCDCGFGAFGIREPIALDQANQIIQQGDDKFRLLSDDNQNFTLQAFTEGEWASQFGFDLYPHEMVDFMPANFFNSKHPDTIFVQKLLVALITPNGRKILLDGRLKRIEKGEVSFEDYSKEEIPALLEREFGLESLARQETGD